MDSQSDLPATMHRASFWRDFGPVLALLCPKLGLQVREDAKPIQQNLVALAKKAELL